MKAHPKRMPGLFPLLFLLFSFSAPVPLAAQEPPPRQDPRLQEAWQDLEEARARFKQAEQEYLDAEETVRKSPESREARAARKKARKEMERARKKAEKAERAYRAKEAAYRRREERPTSWRSRNWSRSDRAGDLRRAMLPRSRRSVAPFLRTPRLQRRLRARPALARRQPRRRKPGLRPPTSPHSRKTGLESG